MDQQVVDARAESTVTMKNIEWQAVLAVLRKGRYDRVAPLIDNIIRQCVQQSVNNASQARVTQ